MSRIQEVSVCRTCLKSVETKKCKILTPQTLHDGKLLLTMLNFCIPEMVIDVGIVYPAICRKCLQRLNNLYKFRKMCLKNDKKYSEKYLEQRDSSKLNVPSYDSDITHSSTTENSTNLPSTASNDVQGNQDSATDVNQNQTSTNAQAITNQTVLNRDKFKKKTFSPYRKRFTNTDCFGCHNRIRDVKYHTTTGTKDLSQEKYDCFNCGKNFTTISQIRKHMHLHLYPYKCEICGKRWRDANQMSVHLRSHTKQKPFECPECDKRFVQSYNLHQHLATHSKGKKNNQNRCEECGKVLSTKYNLKIHLTTHNIGYKPICPKCNKWFYTEAALVKHGEMCAIVKEENEIFIDEPKLMNTEVPEYVKVEVPKNVKDENQSDDDVFIEETSASSQSSVDIVKEEKFVKKEENFL